MTVKPPIPNPALPPLAPNDVPGDGERDLPPLPDDGPADVPDVMNPVS